MNIIFRVDNGVGIGDGHFMRCLSLAVALSTQQKKNEKSSSYGAFTFLMSNPTNATKDKVIALGGDVFSLKKNEIIASKEDLNSTLELASKISADCIVLDGYKFNSNYQKKFKEANLQIIYFDDNYIWDKYVADIIINQNIYAKEREYRDRGYEGKLLLGPRFAMFRDEFTNINRDLDPKSCESRNILITTGGGDGQNITPKILLALNKYQESILNIDVVIGGASKNEKEILKTIDNFFHKVTIHKNLKDMATLMENANIAITTAGSTCWELAFMGVPFIAISVADNQREIAKFADLLGLGLNGGSSDELNILNLSDKIISLIKDNDFREKTSTFGRELFDSLGKNHVASIILSDSINNNVKIRKAKLSDVIEIWNLANQADVRANSFSPDQIPLESHIKWYKGRLKSNDCLIYVCEENNEITGEIRYDKIDADFAEIDIAVSTQHRGKGIAGHLLNQSLSLTIKELNVKAIHAQVLEKNIASIKLFKKIGFEQIGINEEYNAVIYRWGKF